LLTVVTAVLWLSPVAAFGAMASAVGRSGLGALLPLSLNLAGTYL
jgi:Na+/H+-dicarboxylate symporter